MSTVEWGGQERWQERRTWFRTSVCSCGYLFTSWFQSDGTSEAGECIFCGARHEHTVAQDDLPPTEQTATSTEQQSPSVSHEGSQP